METGAPTRRSGMRTRLAPWMGATALLAAVAGTSLGSRPPASAAPAPVRPEVQVAMPVVATVPESATYPAHLETTERVELRPRVSGHLEALLFEDGATVRRGQLLARVDARPFRIALAEAEAALRRARAEADRARREADRAGRLLARRATSEEDAQHRAAAAEVAEAQLAAAEAAVEKARLDLEYTQLRAPIAGRVGRADVTAGNLVGPDTRIATVVSLDPVYVRFDVEEATAARHARADWEVHLLLPGREGQPIAAPMAFLDPEVSAGTGTRRARARVRNESGELAPGMYGRAEVVFGRRDGALLLDEKAVGIDQGQRFVLAVGANDTLEYRPVKLGARHGDLRVVTEGIAASDRVVVNGLARVRPGLQVRPVPAAKEGD